jgi:hypothetical protein
MAIIILDTATMPAPESNHMVLKDYPGCESGLSAVVRREVACVVSGRTCECPPSVGLPPGHSHFSGPARPARPILYGQAWHADTPNRPFRMHPGQWRHRNMSWRASHEWVSSNPHRCMDMQSARWYIDDLAWRGGIRFPAPARFLPGRGDGPVAGRFPDGPLECANVE